MKKSQWEWFGNAAHLCVSSECRFHLATKVGKYIVSTVGEYHPERKEGGDPEEVGCDRLFETMVFEIVGKGHHAMCVKVSRWK